MVYKVYTDCFHSNVFFVVNCSNFEHYMRFNEVNPFLPTFTTASNFAVPQDSEFIASS
jgi:hypothetical protein